MTLKRLILYFAIVVVGYRLSCFGTAITVNEALNPSDHLPAYLRATPHKDYTFFFKLLSWVPWEFTSWHFAEPPVMLAGNQRTMQKAHNGKYGPKPVPERGTWQISYVTIRENVPCFLLFTFAMTTAEGLHFRIGEFRWDDVDGYYVGPTICLKYIKKPSAN